MILAYRLKEIIDFGGVRQKRCSENALGAPLGTLGLPGDTFGSLWGILGGPDGALGRPSGSLGLLSGMARGLLDISRGAFGFLEPPGGPWKPWRGRAVAWGASGGTLGKA